MSRTNHKLVAPVEGTSSDDCIDDNLSFGLRKKRRKIRSGITKAPLRNVGNVISENDSDEAVDINDSDCSESQFQSAMLDHLHGKLSLMPDHNQLIGMLSGPENDGSYSSPLSQKSGKNMADFDDDDSPCDEELIQLAATSHCISAFTSQRSIQMAQQLHMANHGIGPKANRNATIAVKNLNDNNKPVMLTLNEISQPGNILLWDLLMDDKIVSNVFHKSYSKIGSNWQHIGDFDSLQKLFSLTKYPNHFNSVWLSQILQHNFQFLTLLSFAGSTR